MSDRPRPRTAARGSFAVPRWTIAATLLLAAACSGDDDAVDAGRGAPMPGGGAGPLFVSIEVGGGFMPVGHDFRQVPQAVVYADGTSFSPGVITMVYPGPAVLPVIEGELDEDQLVEIIEAASDAGLLEDESVDAGDPPIADAPTTTITVVVDGEEHVTSVYALGTTSAPDGGSPGLTAEQQATRRELQGFVDRVSAEVTAVQSGQYEPERYRVLPLEPQPLDDAVEPDEVRWPLNHVELAAMSCTAVSGEDADALRDALDDASEITRWRTASGDVFALVVRAVLPHEPDCPDPTATTRGQP